MRIRNRLLVLVLAVLVPAVLVAALGIHYVYKDQQLSYRHSMQETTRALALALDKEIARREALLQGLRASVVLAQGNGAVFHDQAREIAERSGAFIVLTDAQGHQILSTRPLSGAASSSPSATIKELRAQRGADDAVISNVYFSPVLNSYAFSVQLPVAYGGGAVGHLEMVSDVQSLQNLYSEHQLPPEWLASIVDRSGILAARSRDAGTYVGQRAGEVILRKIKAMPEGMNEGPTLDGEQVIAFFSRAPVSGWTFVMSVPRTEIQQTAIRAIGWMLGISLLLLGLAISTALAFGRSIARPMEALRHAAERLGNGEITRRTYSGVLEIDAVSLAMERAGAEILEVRADLEQRVANAVAASEQSQRALLQAQKMEALGRLTGGIAHDFNNVLQTLTTGLEIAHISAQDERVKTSLAASQRAVQRGVELVRQLLAFARVQDARLETVDLHTQLRQLQPFLTGALPSNVRFELEMAAGLWPVTLDPLQFELALLNLTMNARDAMPAGGVLRLQAEPVVIDTEFEGLQPGDYVRIAVIDSGAGMTPDVLAKAMDPFFTTKEVGKGSGLGLPQVYGLARQSGGTLVLQSAPGSGTSSILYLPRAAQIVTKPAKLDDKDVQASMRGNILFVEDDVLVRDVVCPALEAAGYTVTVVENADAALAQLKSERQFDALFSDVVMPGALSGIDLAQWAQQHKPGLKILLATGYSDRRIALEGVRMLAKPYTVADVMQALGQELQAL